MFTQICKTRSIPTLTQSTWKHAKWQKKLELNLKKPRVANLQAHRSNSPSTSVEEHYRVNAAILFLDHVIENLNNKFDSENCF